MNWRVFKKAIIGVTKDILWPAAIVLLALAVGVGFVAGILWIGVHIGVKYGDGWGFASVISIVAFLFLCSMVYLRMQREAADERALAARVAARMDGHSWDHI